MIELIAYDFDGVITDGVRPDTGSIVISGRTWAEYDVSIRILAQHFPVYIRGSGAYGDHEHAGEFKATMINLLGVTTFHEDSPRQIEIIEQRCPGVTIVRHGLVA